MAEPGYTGKGVVVGVVDSGIDVHHPAFRTSPTGPTRIVRLLDQTIPIRQTIGKRGTPVLTTPVGFGWTWPGKAGVLPPIAFDTGLLSLPLTKEVLAAELTKPGRIPATEVTVSGGPFPGQDLVVEFIGKFAAPTFDAYSVPVFDLIMPKGEPWAMVLRLGREYSQQEIDAALTGHVDPFVSHDDEVGHGTHVMSVAAGSSVELAHGKSPTRTVGVAPGADLVAVRLDLRHNAAAVEAVRFILDQPWRAPGTPAKPAVANLSVGGAEGPHDGTGWLDQQLDQLVAGRKGRVIVVAAGNEALKLDDDESFRRSDQQELGGQHIKGSVAAGAEVTHKIIVPDRHTAHLELHVWYDAPGRIALDLATPLAGGKQGRFAGQGPALPAPVAPGTGPDPADGDFPLNPVIHTLAGHTVEVSSTVDNLPTRKRHIWLKVRPPKASPVLAGTWLLALRQLDNVRADYHAWGMHAGARHFLFDPGQQDPTVTVNDPGTAKNVITVGAYGEQDGKVYRGDFSSRGPTLDNRSTPKPDVSAPGVDVLGARAGARGTGDQLYRRYPGTSAAAPQVAGIVALMLEAKADLTHERISQILRETADLPPGFTELPPLDSGWGAGLVNGEKAVAKATQTPLRGAAGELLVLPAAAYSGVRLPDADQLAGLLERVSHTRTGRLAGTLLATHVPEIQHLIHTHRRLLVSWLRLHGPQLVRLMLLSEQCHEIPVPARLGGKSVAAGLARLIDELAPLAGPELRADIAAYRELVLALPGVPAADYDQLSWNEA